MKTEEQVKERIEEVTEAMKILEENNEEEIFKGLREFTLNTLKCKHVALEWVVKVEKENVKKTVKEETESRLGEIKRIAEYQIERLEKNLQPVVTIGAVKQIMAYCVEIVELLKEERK